MAFWQERLPVDRLFCPNNLTCVYSTDSSCPYASSTVLPSLLACLFSNLSPKKTPPTIALVTDDSGRLIEISRKGGWDAKQLQAQRRLTVLSSLKDLFIKWDLLEAQKIDLVVIDALDRLLLPVSEEEEKGFTDAFVRFWVQKATTIPFILSFSTMSSLTTTLLHHSKIRIECSFLPTGFTRNVHGRLSISDDASVKDVEVLFRATDSAIVAAFGDH